jgi:hypothetical protein
MSPGAKNGVDSSDDETMNSKAEDTAPEGDLTLIAEPDRATVTLGSDAGEEMLIKNSTFFLR